MKPSFCNSPWIFGAPQSEFSCARRRIRRRTSSVILGLPPRGRDFQRQYRRKLARCQPTTVSGLTITSASRQRDQLVRKIIQKSRSRDRNGGRGRFVFSTATCWRSAMISTAISVRIWKKHEPRQSGTGEQESRDNHLPFHAARRSPSHVTASRAFHGRGRVMATDTSIVEGKVTV